MEPLSDERIAELERVESERDELPNVLVISFDVSITTPQLEQLLINAAGATWEYYAVPSAARERLIMAIDAAIAGMSDEYGRIVPDLAARPKTVDGQEAQ
jgi:hypothetical protein